MHSCVTYNYDPNFDSRPPSQTHLLMFCNSSDVLPCQVMKSRRNDSENPGSNPTSSTCWTWANLGTASGCTGPARTQLNYYHNH